jgi:S-adenosylmethionine synthetase
LQQLPLYQILIDFGRVQFFLRTKIICLGGLPVAKENYLFTSESVSEGHPDKVSDRVSDAIVDTFLAADPLSRVAVETLCTTNRIVLAGEVRGPNSVTHEKMDVCVYVHAQSVYIALGVDSAGNK